MYNSIQLAELSAMPESPNETSIEMQTHDSTVFNENGKFSYNFINHLIENFRLRTINKMT